MVMVAILSHGFPLVALTPAIFSVVLSTGKDTQ